MDYKTALQCATLAQEVYQPFSSIKFSQWSQFRPNLIEKQSTDTQLAIIEDPTQKLAIIVVRGSDSEQDWNINIQFGQDSYDWSPQEKKEYREQMKDVTQTVAEEKDLIYPDTYSAKSDNPVRMHRGFVEAYLSVRDDVHRYIRESLQKGGATRYRITGHSLGGAVATLCAVDLQYNFGQQITLEAYTFGSPRVGNQAFVDSYNRRVPDTWRVVNGWDAVVGVPAPWQGYWHVDKDIKLARRFTWHIVTGSFKDHIIGNYIDALKAMVNEMP